MRAICIAAALRRRGPPSLETMTIVRPAKRRTAVAKPKSARRSVWNDIVPSRSKQRELKREALLRAAVSAFNRQGFNQTSLEEIAQKLGVTKAALYYYFPTKNALLAACFDRAMEMARDSLAAAKREGRNGREKLILMFRRYLETMTGELTESLLLTEEHALTPRERNKLIEQRDSLEAELRDLVKEGIRDGSIVTCDPKLTIFLMLGAINWVPKWFTPKGPWSNAQVARGIGEMLDRMLSTNPQQSLASNVADIPKV
jgi:TetR/AcrR family transcriptional regulator